MANTLKSYFCFEEPSEVAVWLRRDVLLLAPPPALLSTPHPCCRVTPGSAAELSRLFLLPVSV